MQPGIPLVLMTDELLAFSKVTKFDRIDGDIWPCLEDDHGEPEEGDP